MERRRSEEEQVIGTEDYNELVKKLLLVSDRVVKRPDSPDKRSVNDAHKNVSKCLETVVIPQQHDREDQNVASDEVQNGVSKGLRILMLQIGKQVFVVAACPPCLEFFLELADCNHEVDWRQY